MVEYEIRGRCALVTIKRPEARNAVDATVTEGLEAAIDRIEADDDVWVGVWRAHRRSSAPEQTSRRSIAEKATGW